MWPNHQPLAVRVSLFAHQRCSCTHKIFVMKQLSHNLLGLPVIKDLHLLAIENNLQASTIQQKFPTLFTGLGMLEGEYEMLPRSSMDTLKKLHCGHQGIQRCQLHAKSSVWWLNISKFIQNYISQCLECQQSLIPPREPLIISPLPLHPWEKVASDLFHKTYLIVVDYFSRYPKFIQMTSTTFVAVIKALKSVCSRHGVPSVFMSDNGPQFVSKDMREFTSSYGFDLLTSSLLYPQSNSLAERTIKTVKMLLRDSADPYMALLSFCSTPIP